MSEHEKKDIELATREDFTAFVSKPKGVIMIHKHGCGFCEKAKPWIKELAKKYTVAQVNKEVIADLLETFQVKMYPTFVAFTQGTVSDMFYGDTQEEKVVAFIEQHG